MWSQVIKMQIKDQQVNRILQKNPFISGVRNKYVVLCFEILHFRL